MAQNYSAGTASVKISPNMSGFHRAIKRDLRAGERIEHGVVVIPDMSGYVRKLQGDLGRVRATMGVEIRPDMSGFRRTLRAQTSEINDTLDLRVKLDFTMAREQMRAFRTEVGRDLRVDFDLDVTGALARIAAVRAAAAGIGGGSLGGLGGGLGGAAGSAGKLTSYLGAAKIGLVGLAAVNLVPLVGQLAQAAGIISLLPAAATAAAASLATIVIGSTGVFDAFTAGSKASEDAAKDAATAQKQAASDAKASAAAARGVESAQRGVASAGKAVERAQDGVARAERGVESAQKQRLRAQQALTDATKDAREEIEDLNLALKGSNLDERDAELALKRAQQRLRELGKDGQPVTRLDFEEAYLGVDQAKQRIDEVRERNADLREETDKANRAGVEGSAQVIAAQEGIVTADQAVIDSKLAVVEANEGVADAQQSLIDSQQALVDAQNVVVESSSSAATSADKYRTALDNLSPSARRFVEETRNLGGAWGDLRLQVQENLFAGMGSSITDLANNYFPILKNGLGGIATEINGGLKRAIEDLNTESTKLDWSNILENTRLALGPFMDGLSSLAGALTNIASIGSDFLPGGADSFKESMQGFEDWTESEEGQNRIRTFMSDSIKSLGAIKDLFVEIGRVIAGLFTSSETNGKSMVESMTEGLREFADWINSSEGQQRLSQFWDDAQQTATDLLALTGAAITLADKVSWILKNGPGGGGKNSPFDPQNPTTITRTVNPGGAFGANALPTKGLELGLKNIQTLADAIDFSGLTGKIKELSANIVADITIAAVEAWQKLSVKVGEVTIWITGKIDDVKNKVIELKDSATEWLTNIGDTWSGLGDKIGSVVGTIVDTVFPSLTNALTGVQDFFGGVVDGIGTKWSQLKELAATPINWIIDTVINGGLKSAWNSLESVIPGLPKWEANIPRIEFGGAGKSGGSPVPVQKFATGGHVRGKGGPTDDRVPAMLSNGEYVLKASAVDKIGVDNLNRLNTDPLVAKGKVLSEGMFAGLRMATGGSVDEAIERAKKFMSREHGKPYQYGGVGDPSWDCSGLWSGIVHELSGSDAKSGRLFNTESDFESLGWKPGLDGRVTIGVMRGGGGPNSHMAGTIDGTNAESSGTNGVQWGGAAIGSDHSSFGLQYTLQELAGEFVSGGMGSGGGGGSFRSFLAGKVADLLQKPMDAIGSKIPNFGSSMIGQLPRAAFDAISKAAIDFVRSKIGGTVSGRATAADYPYEPGAGADQWDANVRAALAREGFEVNDRNVNLTKAQIMSESSGNPNAVQQVQDVNSGGNEAVGLLQVIPATFDSHRNPDLPNDRTNPDASLSAALRYYRSRYGDDLGQMWGQSHGYANGGIIPGYTPGRDKFQVGVSGGESIMRPEWTRAVGPNYVNSMNALAKKGGIEGVRQAFAAGGIVEDPFKKFGDYAVGRLGQYGSQVGDIVMSGIPEMLGFSGTPLDPSHRYWQAAQEIGTSVATNTSVGFQNLMAMSNQAMTSGGTDLKSVTDSMRNQTPGNVWNINIATADTAEAARRIQQMKDLDALQHTRR